ncbi:phosphate-binding protein 3 [Mycobacterium tuberculosis]|nr:phosphate-binding protein 3 [Mycobacterium tuberculosis]
MQSFLSVATNNGQTDVASVGYIPLPDKVKGRLVSAINAMR